MDLRGAGDVASAVSVPPISLCLPFQDSKLQLTLPAFLWLSLSPLLMLLPLTLKKPEVQKKKHPWQKPHMHSWWGVVIAAASSPSDEMMLRSDLR